MTAIEIRYPGVNSKNGRIFRAKCPFSLCEVLPNLTSLRVHRARAASSNDLPESENLKSQEAPSKGKQPPAKVGGPP